MGMFEMSPEYVAGWHQKCHDPAAPLVEGEEVLAAAGLRQGGAGGMPSLTLETPDGDRATLVAISVEDDPVSQEPIGVLRGGKTAAPA